MSTIRVDEFQASDGLSPSFPHKGVPKAYVNLDASGPTVNASDNVTSLTDNTTGDFGVVMTDVFAATTDICHMGNMKQTDNDTNPSSGNAVGFTSVRPVSTSNITWWLAISATSVLDSPYTVGYFVGDLA